MLDMQKRGVSLAASEPQPACLRCSGYDETETSSLQNTQSCVSKVRLVPFRHTHKARVLPASSPSKHTPPQSVSCLLPLSLLPLSVRDPFPLRCLELSIMYQKQQLANRPYPPLRRASVLKEGKGPALVCQQHTPLNYPSILSSTPEKEKSWLKRGGGGEKGGCFSSLAWSGNRRGPRRSVSRCRPGHSRHGGR